MSLAASAFPLQRARRNGREVLRCTLVLVALGTVVVAGCQSENAGHTKAAAEPPPPPAPVVISTLSEQTLSIEHTYLGEVWAAAEASLSAAEAGRIRKVHVVDGDRVEQGQLLLELDDRLARAELSRALAEREQVGVEREQAEREAERFRQLEKERVSSQLESERETAQAAALQARSVGVAATVQAQSEKVQRHRILAPFDGVVARRHVDPGDWLAPGEPALELVTDDRIEILVRVPVELLDRLSAVESITISRGKAEVAAKLSGAVNALERSTRTALMRLDPEQPAGWLRAGATVDVKFRLVKSGSVVVPRDALVEGVAATRVVRVVDGKADPVNVEVVATNHERVLVQSEDLQPGDRVVTRGNERLRPGQAVKATSAPKTSGAAQPSGSPQLAREPRPKPSAP